MWDVFISHAWEDKESVARPLAIALSQAGLKVWFDEYTLSLGDSLRRSIDRGLSESKFGIVILSPNFFAKEWPQRELDGLTAREVSSGKTVLPVWHQVSRADVEKYSPILADKLSVSTNVGLDNVVQEILRVVKPNMKQASTISDNLVNISKAVTKKQSANTYYNVIQVTTEALRIDPKNLSALYNRANAFRMVNRLDDAIQDATKALRIDPTHMPALFIRAEVYRMLKRYDDAIRDATEALRIYPEYSSAFATRAEAYRMVNRYDDAIRDATEALQFDPMNFFVLYSRAEAYRMVERYDDAIRDATEALRIYPNYSLAFATRATAYFMLKQYDDAVRDATEALHIDPMNALALNTRAEAYRMLSNKK